MKKGSILIMAVAIMASVASCNKSDDTQFTPESGIPVTLKFTASSSPETRIAYDGKEGKWEADDKVYVVVTDTKGTEYTSESCTVTPIDDGATATIDAEFTIGEGTEIKKLTAYHASDNMAVSYDGGNIDFSLPDTPDGTLSYLTTSAYTYDEGSEPTVEQGSDIELSATTLKFKHILARIDITTDIENVSSITLSFVGATVPTAGKLNIENGTITPDNGKDKQLMTIKGGKNTYQIGFIPVKFASATTMKATVITDTKAYTKEVKLTEIVAATLNTLDLSKGSGINSVTPVSTEEALKAMSDSDGDFVLTADITLTKIPNIPGFKGSLDGNGYKISLPETSSVDASEAGIFGSIANDVTITNLNVDAKTLTMNTRNGGIIAGSVTSGTITLNNVHVTGTVTASQSGEGDDNHIFAGGLVGFVKNGAFIAATNCSFSGTITANQPKESITEYQYNSYVGGIVGSVESGIEEEFKNDEYHGSEAGNKSTITNCYVTNSTISNLLGGGTDWPYVLERATEFYTGGIAGRCTGLIIECSVTDTNISGVRSDNGYRKMIKPILGNDYYEHINNDNNSYTNVTINGGEARTGIYKGSKAAGTDTPSYSDL